MVRFIYMRDMILVPIKFIVFLLAVLFAGTAVQALVDFSRLAPMLQQDSASTVPLLVSNGFFHWAIPAIGLTWLFSSFAILKRGKYKRTRQILLLILVAGTMFSVLYFFPPLEKVQGQVTTLDFQVPERTILSNSKAFFVYSPAKDGKGQILLHLTAADSRFRVVNGAKKDIGKSQLVLVEENMALEMDSVVGGRQVLFEDPDFMNPLVQSMFNGLSSYQKSGANNLVLSGILALSTALLLASMWLFVRLTQWPLVNCILSLGMLCLFSLVPGILVSQQVLDYLAFIPLAWRTYLVSGFYSLFSLIFFGCSLLLPSRKDWPAGVNA